MTQPILPHGPLEALSDTLWRVEGALPKIPLRRVMAVARYPDGRLVIHNAICLNDQTRAALEALGRPSYLIVPNGWHRLDAAAYKARYPSIRVLCPRGAARRVAQKVAVDGDIDSLPRQDGIEMRHLAGIREAEGVLSVRGADGVSLVLNDIVFHQPHLPGVHGLVMRYLTDSTGGPKVTRIGRWFVTQDKAALRRDLETLAETPALRRVLVAHGTLMDQSPAADLRRAAATLG